MTKLAGLLKRKQNKVEVPEAFGQDRSELYRRMDRVLARSTRHELVPPKLSPEDYLMAGFPEAPASAYAAQQAASQEDAGYEDGAEAQAHAAETGAQAQHDFDPVPAAEVSHDAVDLAPEPDDSLDTADAPGQVSGTQEDETVAKADASDDLDSLRAMLNSNLAALRSGEPQAEPARDETVADEPEEAAELVPLAWDEEAETGATADTLASVYLDHAETPEMIASDPQDEVGSAEPVSDETMNETGFAGSIEEIGGGFEAVDDQEDASPEPQDISPEIGTAGDAAPAAEVEPLEVILLTPASMTPGEETAAAELTVQIMDYLMFDAGYFPEELPVNGIRAWCMDFYVKNVREGGMGAFVYNAHGQPEIWEACADGLSECGAEAHLDLFNALRDLLTRDAALATALGEDASAGADHEALAALGAEFAAIEDAEPLAELVGRWIVRLPEIEVVEEDALQPIVTTLGEAEGLAARRSA